MENKVSFLKNSLISMLETLDPHAKGNWGVMNAQQMVEHMSDSVRIANGKDPKKLLLPEEQMEKARAFMLSDKPFKENTKNMELPEIPQAPKYATMKESVLELQAELDYFFKVFEGRQEHTIMNPFFGKLNFDQWVHLLDKHARHHLKQFGLMD